MVSNPHEPIYHVGYLKEQQKQVWDLKNHVNIGKNVILFTTNANMTFDYTIHEH